jgi:hypothetical protein
VSATAQGYPETLNARAGRGVEAHRRRRTPQGGTLLLRDVACRQGFHKR